MRAARRTIRGDTGIYLTLLQLVSVLPNDYLIHVMWGGKEVWQGICWVFLYDQVFYRFKDTCVRKFEIDYNNTEATIEVLSLS